MTLEVPAHRLSASGKPAGRIRQKNEQAIIQAAEDEFARHGFKGTSMNTIALKAGLPKANLHYYFTNKLGLYIAVLSNIIELWDSTMEVISGGTCLTEYFSADYREWFRGRAAVFQAWIEAGKMDPVDPVHLIFLLWGSTQHYADFATQICQVTGRSRLTKQDMEDASNNLIHIILKGCGIKPAA